MLSDTLFCADEFPSRTQEEVEAEPRSTAVAVQAHTSLPLSLQGTQAQSCVHMSIWLKSQLVWEDGVWRMGQTEHSSFRA